MMNKEQFYRAYSQIHASERLKQEVLNMKQQTSHHKGLRIALIAAALVILSTGTVLATSFLGSSRVQPNDHVSYTPTDPQGNSYAIQGYEIYLDLATDTNAPTSIAEFYLLQVPDGYSQYHGYLYKDNVVVQYRWKEPDSFTRDIFLSQWAGGDTDSSLRNYVIHTSPASPTPQLRQVTWGGVEGITVDTEAIANTPGNRLFFWSDGQYIFHLGAPLDYTDAQMDALLTTLHKVSNVRPWLIDMTETEIQNALG